MNRDVVNAVQMRAEVVSPRPWLPVLLSAGCVATDIGLPHIMLLVNRHLVPYNIVTGRKPVYVSFATRVGARKRLFVPKFMFPRGGKYHGTAPGMHANLLEL